MTGARGRVRCSRERSIRTPRRPRVAPCIHIERWIALAMAHSILPCSRAPRPPRTRRHPHGGAGMPEEFGASAPPLHVRSMRSDRPTRCVIAAKSATLAREPRAGVRVPRLPVQRAPSPRSPREPGKARGDDPGKDAPQPGSESEGRRRRPRPDAAWMVRVLQACAPGRLRRARCHGPAPAARLPASAGATRSRARHLPQRSHALAECFLRECLLRECRVVRASHGPALSEAVSMKKPPRVEPYAGKPPVRFGGRGG